MIRTGVVLMTYGSPRDLDDVGAYITRVRGGREPSPELLAEFRRRYACIGMSPLIDITRQQADSLEDALGDEFAVDVGMRFSEPSIRSAVDSLRGRAVERIVGLILSPQYSPILMGGYVQALEGAADGLPTRVVESWHLNPAFIDVLAAHIRAALAHFPAEKRGSVPVLLTAHSLPKRVVDREPDYVEQLQQTAHAVASAADLAAERWSFVYQSAGHTPEEWLKPDMLDVLPQLAAAGHRDVVVAPVQFLADHLETLYDVDVAGREQAL
ncbi:MAG: ferrochelatase, partial [Chloroflexi bacterium]|nr:ferrochelatase [Chloroflexota bacterium]